MCKVRPGTLGWAVLPPGRSLQACRHQGPVGRQAFSPVTLLPSLPPMIYIPMPGLGEV
jgi:hypothetical protein